MYVRNRRIRVHIHIYIHTRASTHITDTYHMNARAWSRIRALHIFQKNSVEESSMKCTHCFLTLVYGKELRAIPPRLRPRMTPPPTLCVLRAPRRGELPAPLPRLPLPRALDPLVCLMMSSRLISILSTIFICAIRNGT